MKRLAICVALLMPACVVVRPGAGGLTVVEDSKHPHGGPPGQTKDKEKEHPHGGPPGQMKDKHKHGKKCGHEHKKHKGKVVYIVDDRHEDEDGVVIVIKD